MASAAPNNNHNNNTATKGLRLMILDLHRLLHCMEEEPVDISTTSSTNTANNNNNNNNNTMMMMSPQSLEHRMEYLQSQWQAIQQLVHHQLEPHHQQEEEALPRWYEHYEQRVYRASRKAHDQIRCCQRQQDKEDIFQSSQQGSFRMGMDHDHDFEEIQEQRQDIALTAPGPKLIDAVFFSKESNPNMEQPPLDDTPNATEHDPMVEEHDLIGQPMPAAEPDEDEPPKSTTTTTTTNNNDNNTMDIAAFQKAQRDQIEAAIAQMARQMKEETERIHATLQGQTLGVLDDMEDLATENVAQVTQVAEDVGKHVSEGWKRTFGTWTLYILVASLFLFSLLVIYMIPNYYNTNHGGAPPTLVCRMVDGQEECLDVNAWLTGSMGGSSTTSDDTNSIPEDTTGVPQDDSLDPSAEECQVGMDGTCVQDNINHDAELQERLRQEEERAHEEESEQRQREIAEQKRLWEEEQREEREEEERFERELLEEQQRQEQQQEMERQRVLEEQRQEEERRRVEGEERRRVEEEERQQQQQQQHDPVENQHTQSTPPQAEEDSEEERLREKARLLKEREDRERLHQLRQMAQQEGGDHNVDEMMAERERMRKENAEQLNHRDAFRERELHQLEQQREQRELDEQQRQQQQQDHPVEQQEADSANVAEEAEEISEEEKAKREFWAKQKVQQVEAEKREAERKELETRKKERKREEEAAMLEQERQRLAQQQELERIRQQQEEAPKGFSIESLGTKEYRPRSLHVPVDRELNGGFGANLPRGFGSFGKDDPPPKGVASAGGSAGQEGSGSTPDESDEAPFRGKPFAPRDVRRAAASGDVHSLKDYIEQRPSWMNRKDKNDWAALHLAIKGGHQESVEALVAAGAEVNGRTSQGQTPLAVAVERTGDQSPISVLLRQHGGEM